MGRLNVPEPPQHGVGHGNGAGLGARVRQGTSPKKAATKKAIAKKKAKFLTKDQQALLIVEYSELPPAGKKGEGKARTKALKSARPHIEIVEQAPQSPCTNLCDLGFFNSIDSRLPKLRSFKLPEFIQQIKDAFADYPSDTLDALTDTKCRVIDCIRAAKGQNDFALPHRKKKKTA